LAPIRLTGSSWDHPRGHAPMVATAARYQEQREGAVAVEWTARSLKDFGMASVDALAHQFDLIVIDHPHIGTMSQSGCALPLDDFIDAAQLELLAAGSPGRSHQSYQFGGHQWALAIDAACQTSAWRPDLIGRPPKTWDEVVELAREGRVLWPLGDVDAAASFLTLIASAGAPCATGGDRLADREAGRWALETMHTVAASSDRRCLSQNPIATLETLAHSADFVYSPLLFCYVSYSRIGHPGAKVTYGDIPTRQAGQPPRGSLLGGAGLAVSVYGRARRAAVDYCAYVASSEVQCGAYFAAGGQPAHHQAWVGPEIDLESGRFFSGAGPTIAGAWTRPNGPTFAAFQNDMIDLFGGWFDAASDPEDFLDELDALHRASARATAE
jgi:multiple sugar transport system substrate-binding protein